MCLYFWLDIRAEMQKSPTLTWQSMQSLLHSSSHLVVVGEQGHVLEQVREGLVRVASSLVHCISDLGLIAVDHGDVDDLKVGTILKASRPNGHSRRERGRTSSRTPAPQ